jgi:hypothetical protein
MEAGMLRANKTPVTIQDKSVADEFFMDSQFHLLFFINVNNNSDIKAVAEQTQKTARLLQCMEQVL